MQKIHSKNRNIIIGATLAILFFSLLSIRLGFFREGTFTDGNKNIIGKNVKKRQVFMLPDRDTWMSISQGGKRIGYAHRKFSAIKSGYRMTEETLMHINAMGVAQTLSYRTEGDLDWEMNLKSFRFNLDSGMSSYAARGVVKGRMLAIFAGKPGEENKAEIYLKKPINLAASIYDLSSFKELRNGENRIFYIFDPLTLGEAPVDVSVQGNEEFIQNGEIRRARKITIDFMGNRQYAWLDEEDRVIREKGIMGITLDLSTRKDAIEGIKGVAGADMTELASVRADKFIQDKEELHFLKIKLKNIDIRRYYLDGGRQTLKDSILTIHKEQLSELPRMTKVVKDKDFLKPVPMIQSDHPMILKKVREIVSEKDSDLQKSKKIVTWIYKNVKKRPVLSIPNALETMTSLVGDCNEHAVLLVAMARAAGIPAEIETGLVYMRGRFYYHAWNVLYLGEWVTADATLGQMPADITHIRFIRGTSERQTDLLGIIGKIGLEVIDFS